MGTYQLYKEYKEKTDFFNPEEVIKTMTEIISNAQLYPEQKLFVLGVVFDENKERYIHRLKNEIAQGKTAIRNLEDKVTSLEQKYIKAIEKQKRTTENYEKKKDNKQKKRVVVMVKQGHNLNPEG